MLALVWSFAKTSKRKDKGQSILSLAKMRRLLEKRNQSSQFSHNHSCYIIGDELLLNFGAKFQR